MSLLRIAIAKRNCAFIIRMEDPVQTLKRVLDMAYDQGIKIELMQMHAMSSSEARLSLHCQIDKEKIKQARNCLEKMKGIVELELLESRLVEA